MPRSSAITSATRTTCAGSLRVPRCGTGARNGLSVSIEQPIERDHARHFLQLERARKRHDAGQRDVEADVQRPARHVAVAGEAVKDAADLAGALLVQDAERVVLGLAGVDHDRQPQPARQPDLLAKHLLLDVARREVVVVVEADLADGPRQRLRVDRLRSPAAPPPSGSRRTSRPRAGARRSRTARRASARSTAVACASSGSSSAARMTSALADAGRPRPRDDVVEIAGELRAGDVAVGVDQQFE